MVKATEEMEEEEEEKGQIQEIMSEERGEKEGERNMKCVSSTHRDGTADKCTTFMCLLHFLQKKKQNKPITTLCSCSILALFPGFCSFITCNVRFTLAAQIFTEETGCTNFHRRNWLDECRTASDEHIKTLE